MDGHHMTIHQDEDSHNTAAASTYRNKLYDEAAQEKRNLQSISPAELARLRPVYRMVYDEVMMSLEEYLACASSDDAESLDHSRKCIEAGDHSVQLIDRIVQQRDPSDSWISEFNRRDQIRWYESAAQCIAFERSKKTEYKVDALRLWNDVSPEYRQRNPREGTAHLASLVGNAPAKEKHGNEIATMNSGQVTGTVFAGVLVAFLMLAFFVRDLQRSQWAILKFLAALCAGAAAWFFVGDAALRAEFVKSTTEKFFISGTAGFALFMIVFFFFDRLRPQPKTTV
jgi:hypothetical protein